MTRQPPPGRGQGLPRPSGLSRRRAVKASAAWLAAGLRVGRPGRLFNGVAAALASGCGSAPLAPQPQPQPVAADTQALRFLDHVQALRGARHVPGLAVAVVRGAQVVLARGLGVASVARGAPVTPDTLFDIASVSKPISAVLALRLAERGLIDLDRPLTDYAGYDAFCTGARASGGLFFSDYPCHRTPPTLRQLLAMQSNGVPGSRFLYNPPSFSWASRPLAQAGGAPFSDLVVRDVFGPAGMADAARIHRGRPLPAAALARLALPHRVDEQGTAHLAPLPPPQGDGAAGGVVASAMDLARFDIALTEGRLLQPASLRALWTAGRAPDGQPLPYGLGWYVQVLADETLLWHGGLWEGAYSALYLRLPGRRVSVILLANSDGLGWRHALDEAAVQRSPFAQAALDAFAR